MLEVLIFEGEAQNLPFMGIAKKRLLFSVDVESISTSIINY